MKNCRICDSVHLLELYKADSLPLFQNKVFDTEAEAKNQQTGMVTLVQCQECGFIFNSSFDSSLMQYDINYQNEQSHSVDFVRHLNSVADFLDESGFKEKRIVEIGCGKGFFLDLLKSRGFTNITGFDPAYEGDNPDIIKEYFDAKYKSIGADLIILRHVLEHIDKPYLFLQMLKNATAAHTKIFIEVPDFNWIRSNSAFWDVYYEHCNYFEHNFLKSFFTDSLIKKSFGDQYIYVLGDFNNLRLPKENINLQPLGLRKALESICKFMQVNAPLVIWGASSKGVTLLNILDKNRKLVKYAVDVNPRKQDKYISTTGHAILNPEKLFDSKLIENVIVTNQNYLMEIRNSLSDHNNVNIFSLEKLING